MTVAICTLCDHRPDATVEECSKWPGYYMGCAINDGMITNSKYTCDGKGNLTEIIPLKESNDQTPTQ